MKPQNLKALGSQEGLEHKSATNPRAFNRRIVFMGRCMDNVTNALETLVNLLYLIELDRTEPDRISLYVQMAQPTLEYLRAATAPDSTPPLDDV